ncbi:MAG: hypothetical protein PHQ93_01715 [Sulfurimonas sp.]|uniref:hypothetical protein n=1 Tax=Sulfurimonas sp. TaxID=2022749 RepID=UPI00262A8942|nr:hypothetical protein [Sulfurimonas sp.]MDD5399892.1 hypothetical protein [Sulfurimonas sp.]
MPRRFAPRNDGMERLPRLSLRGFSRGNLNDREVYNDDKKSGRADCRASLAMTMWVVMTEEIAALRSQ